MKKIGILFLFLLISICCNAQSDSTWRFKKKNNITFELLGSGVLYSFNYERLVYQSKHFKSLAEVGFSYAPYRFFFNQSDLQFMFNWNQLYSLSNKSHIDAGAGLKLFQTYNLEKKDFLLPIIFHFGYRYQKPNGNFLFKLLASGGIYKMELYLYPSKPSYIPYLFPSIAVGYCF
ncbi:MAG: hypothetical protein RIQ33_186 [Bacteroidota bacterium]